MQTLHEALFTDLKQKKRSLNVHLRGKLDVWKHEISEAQCLPQARSTRTRDFRRTELFQETAVVRHTSGFGCSMLRRTPVAEAICERGKRTQI